MYQPIEAVEKSERQGFRASSAGREDDFLAFVGEAFPDQARYIARIVLAVAVHDDNGMTGAICFYVGQPHGDSALVTKVTAKGKNIDAFDGCKRVLAEIWRDSYRGPIVHHQDFRFQSLYVQFPVQTGEQDRKRSPVIIYGHENH